MSEALPRHRRQWTYASPTGDPPEGSPVVALVSGPARSDEIPRPPGPTLLAAPPAVTDELGADPPATGRSKPRRPRSPATARPDDVVEAAPTKDGPEDPPPPVAPPVPDDEARSRTLTRLTQAREEERIHIAGEIHDDSIQVLSALSLRLQLLRRHVDEPEAIEILRQAEKTLTDVTGRLRELLFELRPPALDVRGLVASLDDLANRQFRQRDIRWRSRDLLGFEPPEALRSVLFRIGREAIRQIAAQGAANWVSLTLEGRDDGVVLRIQDDGAIFVSSAKRRAGEGLTAMQDEAEVIGGTLRLSGAPVSGVTLEVWLPLEDVTDETS